MTLDPGMNDCLEGDDIVSNLQLTGVLTNLPLQEDPGNREHSRISPAMDNESDIRPVWFTIMSSLSYLS